MPVSEQVRNDIYAQYREKVYGYIRSRINDAQLAEDLCSDVFMKIYEKLDSFDASKASISTWIYTIARNRLTDYYRSRRVLEEIPETLSDGSSVEADVCSRETLDALAEALEKLDSRSRDIVILRYYSGKTLKEIADSMRISYAYVKQLHSRALAALRETLGDEINS